MKQRSVMLGITGLAVVSTIGCGDDLARDRPVAVFLGVQWKDDPHSVDEIGNSVLVDVGWPARMSECFALPEDLSLVVNDRITKPVLDEDCRFDVLIEFDGFVVDEPITVRLVQGHREIAHVTKHRPFEGLGAQLTSPETPILHRNEPITLSLPYPFGDSDPFTYVAYYWRDPPAGVPPFHSTVPASLDAASALVQGRAPELTGRAYLISPMGPLPAWSREVDECVGFESCRFLYTNGVYGPIAVEVVP